MGLLAVAVFCVLWLRARARLRNAEGQRDAAETALAWSAANLVTAPLVGFLWRGRGADAIANAAGNESFAEFVSGLEPAGAAQLEKALAQLRARGIPFDLAVARSDGATVALAG